MQRADNRERILLFMFLGSKESAYSLPVSRKFGRFLSCFTICIMALKR